MHGASQFFLLLLMLPENNRKPEFSDAFRVCKEKRKKLVSRIHISVFTL